MPYHKIFLAAFSLLAFSVHGTQEALGGGREFLPKKPKTHRLFLDAATSPDSLAAELGLAQAELMKADGLVDDLEQLDENLASLFAVRVGEDGSVSPERLQASFKIASSVARALVYLHVSSLTKNLSPAETAHLQLIHDLANPDSDFRLLQQGPFVPDIPRRSPVLAGRSLELWLSVFETAYGSQDARKLQEFVKFLKFHHHGNSALVNLLLHRSDSVDPLLTLTQLRTAWHIRVTNAHSLAYAKYPDRVDEIFRGAGMTLCRWL